MDFAIATSSESWARILGWVDQICPENASERPDQEAKARLFVLSILAGLLVLALSSIRDFVLGDMLRLAWSAAAAALLLVLLHGFRKSGNLGLVTHAFLAVLTVSLVIRIALDPASSQVMVSICTVGLIAAHLISSRAGLYWTLVGTLLAAANATRLTLGQSAEFEVAWAVTIMTAAIGLWSTAHTLAREVAQGSNDDAIQQARDERDRLRVFAESAFPGIIEVAPGRIDYASKGVRQLLGYDPGVFMQAGLQEYVHPEDFWPVVETLQNAPDHVAQVEARLRHAGGHWVWIAAFAIPYSRETNEDRWIFAARDVEREREDRARGLQAERLEGVGLLAAGVAHDFNNLLTVIAGHGELLPKSEHRDNILLAADEAAGLTGRLLSFSQEQPRQLGVFDLNALVVNLRPILRSLLGEQIQLEINPGREACFVRSDPSQLNQVILNIVTNARDAMPNGGHLTMDIDTELLDPRRARELDLAAGNVARLSIRDDGVGMDPQTLEQAFDPFFTTKNGERGTGLGLASAYRQARRCGGHLQLISEQGRGTTAILSLPVQAAAPEPSADQTALSQPISEHAWVLVAEDDPNIRQLISEALLEAGISSLDAADGMAAMEEYDKHDVPPTLLISDVIMPGMKGSVLADKLRLRQPELKVLFISGYSDEKLDPWYEDDESVAFLAKPFRPSQLVQAATRLMGGEGASRDWRDH